jgi:F0F1-type ATP synthase membrane subunit b/b'
MGKTWKLIKDNILTAFAIIGAIIAAVFTLGLDGSSKITEAAFRDKSKSDEARRKLFEDKIRRVREFQEIYANIEKEAKKKEEKLTKEQKAVLDRRRKEYFEADTPEKRQKVREDIQKNFGKLNYVPLSDIADVEDSDD